MTLSLVLLAAVEPSPAGPARPASRAGAPQLATCALPPTGAADADTAGGGGGPVEVTFWYAEAGPREAVIGALVEEFDRAHASISVHVESRGTDRSDVMTGWREATPDDRPSLALMTDDVTRRLADSGQTVAPGGCLGDAIPGLLPSIEAAWSVDGLARAVPFAVSTPVLVYDRRAFEAAGLDPDRPPRTLPEVRAAARRLVERQVTPTGLTFGSGAGSAGSWFVEQWNAQVGAPLVDAGRPGEDRPPHAVWQSGPATENLEWVQAMVADGLAESAGSVGCCEDLVRLLDHRAAMTIHTSGALVEFVGTIPDEELDVGVGPLPGPGSGSLPGGAALWLAAGRPPQETTAAWGLAAFLASPPSQARLAAATGYVPVTADATSLEPLASAWAADPGLAVAFDVLAAQPATEEAQGLSLGPEEEVKHELADALERVLAGVPPADALREVADRADALLEAYWRDSRAQPVTSPPASSRR